MHINILLSESLIKHLVFISVSVFIVFEADYTGQSSLLIKHKYQKKDLKRRTGDDSTSPTDVLSLQSTQRRWCECPHMTQNSILPS